MSTILPTYTYMVSYRCILVPLSSLLNHASRTMNMPILIIGAGLSGLTTARLLTNSGIPNIVFEASPPDRSQGFSISLRDWGYEVLLEALGGLPLSSLTRGVAPDRHVGGHGWVDLVMRDSRTGEVLVAPDPATQPSIVRANRNALRAWIADCGDDELDIRYGHRLQSVQGTIGDMTAVFENGSRYRGSLVVAADGVHSTGTLLSCLPTRATATEQSVIHLTHILLSRSPIKDPTAHRPRSGPGGGVPRRIPTTARGIRAAHPAPSRRV